MHTNHRRRNKFRGKHHNRGGWFFIYSLKPMKRQKARDRRAEERMLMAHGRFDDLRANEPPCIRWEYW